MDSSFLGKLRLASIFGGPGMEPGPAAQSLFGGLIPRRIERIEPEQTGIPRVGRRGMEPIQPNMTRQPGINNLGKAQPGQSGQSSQGGPSRVNFVDTDIERDKLNLDKEKHRLAVGKDAADRDLEERKFGQKTKTDEERLDLDNRKLALDKWQSENPQGELKTDDEGNILVIDKRTGESINTGIKTGDLSEDEKLKRGLANQKEIESVRQKNRTAIERIRQAGRDPQRINPSQQRIAEDDAARSLINGKYSHLKDYITVDKDGIKINKPTAGSAWGFGSEARNKKLDEVLFGIDAFEQELKTEANKRVNMAMEKPEVDIEDEEEIVDMIDDDGNTRSVPKSEVEDAKAAGLKLSSDIKPVKVADDIELTYDDKGRVIGARNRKPPKKE